MIVHWDVYIYTNLIYWQTMYLPWTICVELWTHWVPWPGTGQISPTPSQELVFCLQFRKSRPRRFSMQNAFAFSLNIFLSTFCDCINVYIFMYYMSEVTEQDEEWSIGEKSIDLLDSIKGRIRFDYQCKQIKKLSLFQWLQDHDRTSHCELFITRLHCHLR